MARRGEDARQATRRWAVMSRPMLIGLALGANAFRRPWRAQAPLERSGRARESRPSLARPPSPFWPGV